MTQSKLYNALLKTQSVERARRATVHEQVAEKFRRPGTGKETAEDQSAEPESVVENDLASETASDSVFPDDPPMEEDFSDSDPELTNWTSDLETERPGWPPVIYDSRATLDMIYNPRPWTVKELRQRKVIYPGMANRKILNAYRELRITLRNLSGVTNFSVMMSSLSRRPGSILTSFNLAASFALDSDSTALLVDCDPYQSDIHNLVSIPMAQGITDYVAHRDMTVPDIIYPSGIDRLNVIPAGKLSSSAVELFSSVRMRELMEELVSRYPDRYIILNAPPFRVSTEARILERYVRHAVLAVPFGELTADEIMNAADSLDPEKFAGIIYQE